MGFSGFAQPWSPQRAEKNMTEMVGEWQDP